MFVCIVNKLHMICFRPEESKPLAPMAPLCFRVNARPPEGFLYYFAYGMDMNISR